jgi:hypothetical protein
MVQPKSALLVLFYDQAQRICSPTPTTGAIPIHTIAPAYYGNELERAEPRQIFRV